jgi:hypothetical protein
MLVIRSEQGAVLWTRLDATESVLPPG